MNTMLGEIAKLNDLLYPRYRFAFKMRKLQQTFMLEHVELPLVQDTLHATGVEPLASRDIVPAGKVMTVMAELFGSVRRKLHGKHTTAQLQEAHTTCLNWVMGAFDCDAKNTLTAGALKVFFCLFCGSSLAEKAKYLFGVLSSTGDGGNVGRDELLFFCGSVQVMASYMQEIVYATSESADRAISECLYFIREEEDIEDEEDYGGLQRPWLSLFEFTKVFCASPALNFLSWVELWYSLPAMEKVVHPVKCAVCGVKNMTGFRYQCTKCPNFNMCEMCFLKGRIAEPHEMTHKVLECLDYSKSLKSRFGIKSKTASHSKDFRVMDEPSEMSMSGDTEYPDGSMFSLASSCSSSKPAEVHITRSPDITPEHSLHLPTIIRIGSSSSLKRGKESSSRQSISSSGSIESYGSSLIERANSPSIAEAGQRVSTPVIPSIRRRANTTDRSNLSRKALDVRGKVKTLPNTRNLHHILLHKAASDNCPKDEVDQEFQQINRRLSMEVDTLMQDLLPELEHGIPTGGMTDKMRHFTEHQEAVACQREKMTGEVDSLLQHVHQMHSGYVSLKNGVKPLTPRTRNGHMKPSRSMPKDLSLHLSHSHSLHSPGCVPMVY